MKMKMTKFGAIAAILALAGCGGGTGGFGGAGSVEAFAERYAALGADPNLAAFTPQATLDGLGGSASYDGVVNMNIEGAGYYGNGSMTANFASNTISGSAGSFVKYYAPVASPTVGDSVAGSMSFTGAMTASNESLSDGIIGVGTGTIEGQPIAYDVSGNMTGLSGEGAILYFNNTGAASGGGVGFLLD